MTLIEAIKENNKTEVLRLLDLEIDPFGKRFVDEIDAESEGGPLYWAVALGYTHFHFIDLLITARVDVNKPGKDGKTPVYVAAQNGHAAAITALHATGANVNTPDNDGETPVYTAAGNGHAAAVTALHAAGANVNTPDDDGETPVYAAAENGCPKAIDALREAGANVNRPDNDGKTPVFIAAEKGYAPAIIALLEAGADASIKTPFGTALEQAKQGKAPGHVEVVKILEARLRVKGSEVIFSRTSALEQKSSPLLGHTQSPPAPKTAGQSRPAFKKRVRRRK